uniref:NADH dehydrogenase [ubiquinone] 1 alpha subcomplex subunit 13 n=1 Tax=Panagrolaimus sp. ES5 TaxID=591445 RepID=A0AC34G7U1_9BILA
MSKGPQYQQEMPPPGGYRKFNWERTYPKVLWRQRDREWLRLLKKNREIENELMKDVPGWKTGTWFGEPVYYTLGEKWWDPAQLEIFAHSPRKSQMDEMLFHQHSEYSAPKFYDKWIPEFIGRYIW